MPIALLPAQSALDCAATGLCLLAPPPDPVPSGLFFLAVGLVGFGVRGLLVRRRGRLSAD